MIVKYLLIFIMVNLFFSFSNTAIFSQSYQVRNYIEDDGLANSFVFDITQDHSGCLWFAARNGISTYDSSRWKTYTFKEGLPSTEYSQIKCDNQGTIWALSMPENLVTYFNGQRWILLPKAKLPQKMERGFISSFEVVILSNQNQKVVALGTRGAGLFLWTTKAKDNKWETIDSQKGLISSSVNDISAYGGRLYTATENGLSVLTLIPGNDAIGIDIDNGINEILELPSPEIIGIAVEKKKEDIIIWLLGKQWVGYLENNIFKVIAHSPGIRHDEFGIFLQPDNRGGIFYGNRYGIFHVDKRSGLVRKFGKDQGLIAGGATGAYIDREKNIWFSTLRGVSKISGMRFANYRKLHGLLNDETTAVWEIEPGSIVFGHINGITFFKDNRLDRLVLSRKSIKPTFHSRILDIRGDQKGNVWVAASDRGLAKINKKNIIQWYGSTEGLPGQVTSVLVDSSDNVWAATGSGVFVLQGSKFIKIETGDNSGPLYVRRLFPGPAPGLWIYMVTTTDGVYSINIRKKEIKSFLRAKSKNANNVFSLLFDSRGRIWVGSRDGLYTGEKGTLIKFNKKGFQINRPVYFIVEDTKHRLWFGTDNGVIKWDGQKGKEYTVHQGLAGRETNRAAGCVDSRGRVWIGTDRGVSCYREEFEKRDIPPPFVQLLSLSVDTNDRQMSLQKVNKLKHDMNNLVFHFRVASFIDENATRCQTKLEGFDPDWSPGSAPEKGQVRYTNLPPGRYRFHLKAKNAEGLWSDVVSSADIIIQGPFWKKWWFYVILFLTIGFLLHTIQGYFSKRRYASLLEKQVNEKTEELRQYHHHLQEMVETRTAELTSANVQLKKEINERTQAEEKIEASLREKEVLLKEIHHRVKNNLQIISSLLSLQSGYIDDKQTLRLFKNSQERVMAMALIHEKLYQSGDLSRIDFQEYIRSLIPYLFESYSLKSGHVRLDMEIENVALNIETAIPLGLIVNELVSNSLKHAFPGSKEGELQIKLEKSEGKKDENGYDYTLIIADNGIGFPDGLDFKKSDRLGMVLVHSLVKKLRGAIDLDRREGTRFIIKFKKLTEG